MIYEMKRTIKCGLLLACVLMPASVFAQIRLNQVGMYPSQEKTAVIEGEVRQGEISVVSATTGESFQPKVLRVATSPWSGKRRTIVDFSQLTTPGNYTIKCGQHTVSFSITKSALQDVTKGALKSFYLMRTGMPIEECYAGEYARPMGHPDTQVYIHPSAASPKRKAGSVISSSGGWYDAGDYNKYIVNSAFSIGIVLVSYEQNKAYYDRLTVNIPESGNQTADVLDEMMYNLRWMLTMQDPDDGGVYHKLTTPSFEGFIMPTDCHQPRYVVQKSTAATLDFAAVMAQAARIFRGNSDYPHFAEQAQKAALSAYQWAACNPQVLYNQDKMNEQFDPDVYTGTYGDGHLDDEWFWAATELYLLTGDKIYARTAEKYQPQRFSAPTWGNVATLGVYDWLGGNHDDGKNTYRDQLLGYCDSLIATTATSSFQTPSGNSPRDFGWGCLAEAFCANGLSLLYAYRLTGDAKYLVAAQQNLDYILGRNATGYCYITGFGSQSPMFPHQRLSAADGIVKPLPGFLVGGPNPGQQDKMPTLVYTSNEPDESYMDKAESYASNEIAINWNASLLALLGWLENYWNSTS